MLEKKDSRHAETTSTRRDLELVSRQKCRSRPVEHPPREGGIWTATKTPDISHPERRERAREDTSFRSAWTRGFRGTDSSRRIRRCFQENVACLVRFSLCIHVRCTTYWNFRPAEIFARLDKLLWNFSPLHCIPGTKFNPLDNFPASSIHFSNYRRVNESSINELKSKRGTIIVDRWTSTYLSLVLNIVPGSPSVDSRLPWPPFVKQ